MQLEITFRNAGQRAFYFARNRNQCFSGGFNNGKTYIACSKLVTLLLTFPFYRVIIARETYKNLRNTTMATFFKIVTPDLVASHNNQEGMTILINGSMILWMHLDTLNENSLRGVEADAIMVDQAEEIQEWTYDILDARVGRWDKAIVPEHLLKANPNWPRNPETGRPLVPNYMMLLCNPDTQFHFIYRKYHPESMEKDPDFFFVEGEWDATLGSPETYANAMKHGDEWIEKYIKGKWGISSAQIHRVHASSLIEYSDEILNKILRQGNLFRILDHGDASPACCLWVAVLGLYYIVYREYYTPGKLISYHRQAIHDLSGKEQYAANYADPSIFHKASQKDGGFWTTAEEYMDPKVDGPPLYWLPADNNEFATRNRINELLKMDLTILHPFQLALGCPKILFLKRSAEYPQGCVHVIKETQSQRRKLIGYVDGTAMYSDDREDSVTDHSYDCLRYFVAMHSLAKSTPERVVKPNTIGWYRKMMSRRKNMLSPASAN